MEKLANFYLKQEGATSTQFIKISFKKKIKAKELAFTK